VNIGRFYQNIKTSPDVHQVHIVVYLDFIEDLCAKTAADYKTVRGLSRGLLLLNLLNKFDGGATPARWLSLAACIAPPSAGCWRRCRRRVTSAAAAPMTASV
jgi:hypothetical protein